MKLLKDYRQRLINADCKISDLLVFEDLDFDTVNEYLASICSDWTYTKDVSYLYTVLEMKYYNYAGCRTKFARMQHDQIMQGVFGRISPVLEYVFAEMHPIRDRVRKFHDRLIRDLPFNPEMTH
jgi:hypothetical protein